MPQHYRGSCHCGRVTFELDCDLTTAVQRNCSICRRKGVPMALAAEGSFRLTGGEEHLGLYQFHTRRAKHYFCKVCGIYTHHNPRSNPQMVRVNTGCLEGVDPLALTPELIDGASFD